MNDVAPILARLTKRPQFLACARGQTYGRPSVLVQALGRTDDQVTHNGVIRMGFTATKRLGGAVERNRAKRRLREAARKLLPLYGCPGFDYVFMARAGVLSLGFEVVLDDVKRALIRLNPSMKKLSGPQV